MRKLLAGVLLGISAVAMAQAGGGTAHGPVPDIDFPTSIAAIALVGAAVRMFRGRLKQ